MSRATFSSLKSPDADVFVVKIAGHLGARERKSMNDLLRKCDEKAKKKVIFELSELESLGGGVAKDIGDFAARRGDEGHPPVFAGASDTVRNFLGGRSTSEPVFVEDLDAAYQSIAGGSPTGAEKSDAAQAKKQGTASVKDEAPARPSSTARPTEGGDAAAKRASAREAAADKSSRGSDGPVIHLPDMSLEDEPMAGTDVSQSDHREPTHGATNLRILEVDRPLPAGRYLSLEEAEQAFAAATDLAGMKGAVGALLYGVDLASVCHLMTPKGEYLVEVGEAEHKLPLAGTVVKTLLSVNTPIPMEDLSAEDLQEAEADFLTQLNCQMAIPVVVGGQLEGALFLRKSQAGSEYEPSEVLALDLLGRKLAHALQLGGSELSDTNGGDAKAQPKKSTGSEDSEERASKEMSRKIHQQKALFNISKDFNSTRDEEHLVNLVLLTTIAQVGVGTVAYFELEGDNLVPRKSRGLDEIDLSEVPVEDVAELLEWKTPSPLSEGGKMRKMYQRLEGFGFETAAPLRSKENLLGVLALGPRLSGGRAGGVDLEFLTILLNQAGVALENAHLFRDLHNRTLGVAKTFVTLIEKRSGPAARASTELISHYVGRVAQNMAYPPEQIRDLIYGTVLRDIGMIEISDLVLRSPRSLTPEEWKLIKQHPMTGVEILRSMDFCTTITDVVLYHHERFNGEGYPHGLRGAAIPLGARIVAAVEAFVAMTRDLPYRAALSRPEALEVMRENWGMRYDPEVLHVFLGLVEPEGDQEPQVADLIGVS